jgi:tRNA(Ile)-lysidine synthetase-like protein
MRPDPLTIRIRRRLVAERLLVAGAPVVVGVSGGADSLCLLDILDRLRNHLGVGLHVAHLNHMLRGAAAEADAQFVAAEAQRRGLPATIASADIAAIAAAERGNTYAVGRRVRYRFLADVALAIGAQAVAVAHHADDQAETVLMHLLRGAGSEGLAGMRRSTPFEAWQPRKVEGYVLNVEGFFAHFDVQSSTFNLQLSNPALLRPLLDEPRAEIERYCREHGLAARHDESNDDTRHLRARVRTELMPLLKEYNPQIVEALGRSAAISADEHALVAERLDALWPTLARQRADGIDIDGAVLRGLNPALQRAALRRAYMLLTTGTALEFGHVEAARALIGRGAGRRTEWPGDIAVTTGYGGELTIGAPQRLDIPQLPEGVECAPLDEATPVALSDGWRLLLVPAGDRGVAGRWEVLIDADALGGALIVRRRRPRDRMRPAGGRGTRRLQDLFVDARIPRRARAAWPILATAEQVVWVAGVALDEAYTPRSGSRMLRAVVTSPATHR